MVKRINIAIIGSGAASVALLKNLLECSRRNRRFNLNITIFESADVFGVGFPYQNDLENLLINRPLQTMSANVADLGEFHTWLQNRPELLAQKITESDKADDQRAYISRHIFGLYLTDTLSETAAEARKLGIEVTFIKNEVLQIHAVHPFVIEVADEETFSADFLIFCTGLNQPKDIFGLKETPRYIHIPYPISKHAQMIKPTETVGIIGNSLTAVDISISLRKTGHTGAIAMMSRMHLHPRTRGKMAPYELKYLTREAILSTKEKRGILTLRDSIRLLRRELQEIGYDWRELFVENDPTKDFVTLMKHEVAAAQTERKWQAILSATNEVVEVWWNALDLSSKVTFLNHFHRNWLTNRSPIPIKNSKILIEMA